MESDIARPASVEAGMRLSAELQVSYATGIVAGTLMAAWQIIDYGRETGFENLWLLQAAAFVAAMLEMVSLGMILHIMYRGFWIAMRLLVETRVDQGLATKAQVDEWEGEIRELDGACQAIFFRTFRILYAGMFWGAIVYGWSLLYAEDLLWNAFGYFLLAVVLPPSLVRPIARRWPVRFLKERWLWLERELTGVRRTVGLWWLSSDPAPLSRNQWIGLSLGFLTLFGFNWIPMVQSSLTTDKQVYFRGADDKIVATFRHGGVVAGPEATVQLSATATGTTTDVTSAFKRVGTNTHIAVLDARHFRPGPVELSLKFQLGYESAGGKSHLRMDLSHSAVAFLVSP